MIEGDGLVFKHYQRLVTEGDGLAFEYYNANDLKDNDVEEKKVAGSVAGSVVERPKICRAL